MSAVIYYNGSPIPNSNNYYYKWYVYLSNVGAWQLLRYAYGYGVNEFIPETLSLNSIRAYVVVTDSINHTFANIQSPVAGPFSMPSQGGLSVGFMAFQENGQDISSLVTPRHWRYTIGQWKNKYNYILTLNYNERIQAYPGFISALEQKLSYWNNNTSNILNYNIFFFTEKQNSSVSAHYKQVKGNVIITTSLLETGGENGGIVKFKDPWLVDTTDTQFYTAPFGYHSLGMDAPFKPENSPLHLTFTSKYKGVFLSQSGPPDWNPPYYSVRAPQTRVIPVNSRNIIWYFQGWGGSPDSVAFQNAALESTAVVFKQPGAVARALYKGHLASNKTEATAFNNGRKMVRTHTGAWHMVYEDNGNIYYTRDTSSGADFSHSWGAETLLASGDCSHPNIATDSYGYLHVVYEQKISNYYGVFYRRYIPNSGWDAPVTLATSGSGYPNYNAFATPGVYAETPWDVTVVWSYTNGLVLRYFDGTWNSSVIIPGTQAGDRLPSIAKTASGINRTKIVWSRNGSSIYYIEGQPSGSGWSWGAAQNLTAPYPWIHDVDAPSIIAWGAQVDIVWQGQVNSGAYTLGPIFYLNKNSGILTDFSPYFGVFYQYPSVSSTSSGDLAIAYFEPNQRQVYLRKRVSGSWAAEINEGSGQYPSLNPPDISTPVHLLYNAFTTLPYILSNQVAFYFSGGAAAAPLAEKRDIELTTPNSPAGAGSVQHFRRVDVPLSAVASTAGINGHLTIDLLPTAGSWEFKGGNPEASAFFESSPFAADSLPHGFTLKARLSGFRFTGIPSVLDYSKPLLQFDLKDARTGDRLREIGAVTLQDVFLMARQGDSLSTEVLLPSGTFASPRLAIAAAFPAIKNPADIHFTDGYRALKAPGKKSKTDTVRVAAAANPVPQKFILFQNYPNPFNPSTTIRFTLPQREPVKLVIYAITGQRVATLVNEEMSAGSHQVRWNGRDQNGQSAASGVYIYQLFAGKQRLVKKMLLLK